MIKNKEIELWTSADVVDENHNRVDNNSYSVLSIG